MSKSRESQLFDIGVLDQAELEFIQEMRKRFGQTGGTYRQWIEICDKLMIVTLFSKPVYQSEVYKK